MQLFSGGARRSRNSPEFIVGMLMVFLKEETAAPIAPLESPTNKEFMNTPLFPFPSAQFPFKPPMTKEVGRPDRFVALV